jgi:hypothetical protein
MKTSYKIKQLMKRGSIVMTLKLSIIITMEITFHAAPHKNSF